MSNIYPRADILKGYSYRTGAELDVLLSLLWSLTVYTTAQRHPIWRLMVKEILQEEMKIHQAENLKLVLLSNKKKNT